MSMLTEFREFAIRGNVIDLAVGVIIGAAFGKIVSSLGENLVMPLVGILIGGFDFKSLAWQFHDAKIQYGVFLQSVVDFIIIAWAIFIAVRVINHVRRRLEAHPDPAAAAAAPPPRQEQLLEEIRDLLKKR
jgi:large conductance mechanosensitive channel